MPTREELQARTKTPAELLGTCQRGCNAPGQYEHVRADGKTEFLCGICWHRAQAEQQDGTR